MNRNLIPEKENTAKPQGKEIKAGVVLLVLTALFWSTGYTIWAIVTGALLCGLAVWISKRW